MIDNAAEAEELRERLAAKFNTIGGVGSAADTLMTIVPDDAQVAVEAQDANKNIGIVSDGRAAGAESFNFTRYGTVQGRKNGDN